jgi:hypothetical protein
MAAASEKECQNMATLQLPADNHFATITNPVHHIVERKMRCASQQNRYSMTDMVNRDWAGQAAGPAMSAMPR